MLARSQLLGSIGGGRIVLRDPNTHGEVRVTVDKGELRAEPGMPLRLTLKGRPRRRAGLDRAGYVACGRIRESRAAIGLQDERRSRRFARHAVRSIARPIGSELGLALDASGTRFDNLNKLAHASLPPWGPWSAVGKFRMSPRGYEVNDLRLQVGESVLAGQGRLDTEGGRPRIAIALTAPVVQLDDFKLGDWSPVEKKPDDKAPAASPDELRNKAAAASDQAQKL